MILISIVLWNVYEVIYLGRHNRFSINFIFLAVFWSLLTDGPKRIQIEFVVPLWSCEVELVLVSICILPMDQLFFLPDDAYAHYLLFFVLQDMTAILEEDFIELDDLLCPLPGIEWFTLGVVTLFSMKFERRHLDALQIFLNPISNIFSKIWIYSNYFLTGSNIVVCLVGTHIIVINTVIKQRLRSRYVPYAQYGLRSEEKERRWCEVSIVPRFTSIVK